MLVQIKNDIDNRAEKKDKMKNLNITSEACQAFGS